MSNAEKSQHNEPIPREKIYKIMLNTSFIVAFVFMLKDLIGKNFNGAIFIGAAMAVYSVILVAMKIFKATPAQKQLTVSIVIMLLIFFISLNSGAYYSDDYLLYLTAYGLTGLYLRPKFTRIQIVIGDILLIIQYIIHPEKVESFSQFIMCMLCFTLAGIMIMLLIQRGRAFIERSEDRAKEAERLINSIRTIGAELQHNFESSSEKMNYISDASEQLNSSADKLTLGSHNITSEAKSVYDSCEQVQDKMKITENQIEDLNQEMKKFESILAANSQYMNEMNEQMNAVRNTINETNTVFHSLNCQMEKITGVTDQLTSISSSTTMLALNASIEAARAGQAGAGFAVVAGKVQDLAVDSNQCANEVVSVVESMKLQISRTASQLNDSTESINNSLVTLSELQNSFEQVGAQFGTLYKNIEVQNGNINDVTSIFAELEDKISSMSNYSENNQASVQSIADTIQVYQNNISHVIQDTMQLQELSESMMNVTSEMEETYDN